MRWFSITLLGLGLLLGGCDALGKITPESIVAEIQKDCGIVVPLADVAALVTANPAVAGVAGFAKMVCDAFHAQHAPASRRADAPRGGVLNINGVDVHYVVK